MSQLLWPSLKPVESRDKKSGVKDLRDKLNAKSSDPRSPSSSLKSLSLSNVKSPKPPATTGNKEECLQIHVSNEDRIALEDAKSEEEKKDKSEEEKKAKGGEEKKAKTDDEKKKTDAGAKKKKSNAKDKVKKSRKKKESSKLIIFIL